MRGCEWPLRPRSLAAGLMAAGLLTVSACSEDDGIGARYQVTGSVTYKGKPLDKGQIRFVPKTPEGRPASGDIEAGRYRLTTQTSGDGALPGEYGVAVIAMEADLTKAIEKQHGGLPNQVDLVKAYQKAKRSVPAKYEDPGKSGLSAEVKAQSNTFDFPLTD